MDMYRPLADLPRNEVLVSALPAGRPACCCVADVCKWAGGRIRVLAHQPDLRGNLQCNSKGQLSVCHSTHLSEGLPGTAAGMLDAAHGRRQDTRRRRRCWGHQA